MSRVSSRDIDKYREAMQTQEPDAEGVRPVIRRRRLIDFERAEVVTPMIEPPRPTLVVSGEKPDPNMEVKLVPLVYIQTPEYWGIEVVGTLGGADPKPTQLPAGPMPYQVQLELEGFIGTAGVEVIGANCVEQIPVAT
ncbi:MAG TPA: hypothetical protein VFC00_02140 [Micromonosporaceae bacterium]|nr:hypothetical protein [Micromonosporaceae bacterium]